MSLIDGLHNPMVNRALLQDALDTLEDAFAELKEHPDSGEYRHISNAIVQLKIALAVP